MRGWAVLPHSPRQPCKRDAVLTKLEVAMLTKIENARKRPLSPQALEFYQDIGIKVFGQWISIEISAYICKSPPLWGKMYILRLRKVQKDWLFLSRGGRVFIPSRCCFNCTKKGKLTFSSCSKEGWCVYPSHLGIRFTFKESIKQNYGRNCTVVKRGRRLFKNNSLLDQFFENISFCFC